MRFTTKQIRLVLAAVALLFTLLPTTASAEKRDAAFVYLARDGVTMECNSTGGSCFPLVGDERTMSLAVVDDLQADLTGARYELRDATGAVLAAADFCDATAAAVPPGAVELRVLVRVLDPVSCLPAGVGRGSTGKVRVHFDTREGAKPVVIDNEPQECFEAAPTDVGIRGTTDEGQVVDVDVLVLLDGIDEATARELFRLADQAYAPLGVRLVPHRYQEVDFPGPANGQRLISHAINTVRGEVPEQYDLVHVLTDKDMNVFGIADCIGGVRYPDRAFSVSSMLPDRDIQIAGPVTTFPVKDSSAKTLAHEIGHLLGAHHHLGNHHEGGGTGPDFETATLMMSPAAMPRALRFSTVNGAIVRGHAMEYAQG